MNFDEIRNDQLADYLLSIHKREQEQEKETCKWCLEKVDEVETFISMFGKQTTGCNECKKIHTNV